MSSDNLGSASGAATDGTKPKGNPELVAHIDPAAKSEIAGHGSAHGSGGGHGPATGYWALALGALGVVYGDIGTSPLYALRETINAAMSGQIGGHGSAPGIVLTSIPRDIVIGVLSLIDRKSVV